MSHQVNATDGRLPWLHQGACSLCPIEEITLNHRQEWKTHAKSIPQSQPQGTPIALLQKLLEAQLGPGVKSWLG